MKKKDMLLIAAALIAALALYGASLLFSGEVNSVVVTVAGVETMRRPLAVDGTYTIEQENGARNVFVIRGGAVYMQEANCRDGLCINQGKTRHEAKSIVCLPNEVVLRLDKTAQPEPEEDELDVIIQ